MALRVHPMREGGTVAGTSPALAGLLEALRSGDPGLVRVSSPSPAARSRLLDRFALAAAAHGAPVLAGVARDTDRYRPLGVVLGTVERAVVRQERGLADRTGYDVLLVMRAALRSLDHGRWTSDLAAVTGVERHRMHRLLRTSLGLLAAGRRLVLVLDDLQLADDGTLELLDHLVSTQPAQAPLLVFSTEEGPRLQSLLSRATTVPLPGTATDGSLPELDPVGAEVAWATAVLGHGETGAVAAVAGVDRAEVSGTLSTLQAAHVLVPDDVTGRLVYRHRVLREAVVRQAPPGWLAAAHARAVAVLADQEDIPAALRAHHREQAGRAGPGDPLPDLERAADLAAGTAPGASAHWLQAALRAGGLPPAVDLRLRLRLADVLADAGRSREAGPVWRSALPLVTSEQARARLVRRYADALPRSGRPLLVEEVRRGGDRTLRLDLAAGLLAEDPDRAAAVARQALAEARERAEAAPLAAALGLAVLTAVAVADLDGAGVRWLDEAAALVDALPDPGLAGWTNALRWIGQAEAVLERPRPALRHAERGVRLARLGREGHHVPGLLLDQAWAYARLGRLPEAADCFADVVAMARLTGAGALEAAGAAGSRWVAWWRAGRPAPTPAASDLLRAEPAVEAVDAAALTRLGGGADLPLIRGPARVTWHAALAAAAGRTPEAAGQARRSRQAAAQIARQCELPLRAGHALLATAVADPDGAPATAAAAGLAFEAVDDRLHAGWAHLVAAAGWRDRGRDRESRRQYEKARPLLDACDPGLFAVLSQRRADGPGIGRDLTDRERAVLTLLSDGLTADTMARELGISPRTVHHHLERLYRKLGTKDRLMTVLRAQALGLVGGPGGVQPPDTGVTRPA